MTEKFVVSFEEEGKSKKMIVDKSEEEMLEYVQLLFSSLKKLPDHFSYSKLKEEKESTGKLIIQEPLFSYLSEEEEEEESFGDDFDEDVFGDAKDIYYLEKDSNDRRLALKIQKEQQKQYEESLAIAKQLQEEEMKNQENEMKSLQYIKFLEEREKEMFKKCSICLDDKEFYISLEGCNCSFCYHCLGQYLEHSIKNKKIPVPCPNCKKKILQKDINLTIDNDLYQKYLRFDLDIFVSSNEDYNVCPTPGCIGKFNFEKGTSYYKCNFCKKEYCLQCKCTWHSKSNCVDYRKWKKENSEGDVLFDAFVKGKKFKQCDQCKIFVEKNQGCDHITCKCGYQFCYICGKKWKLQHDCHRN